MLSCYSFANCYLIHKLLSIFNYVKFVTMLAIYLKISAFVNVIHSFILIHFKKKYLSLFFCSYLIVVNSFHAFREHFKISTFILIDNKILIVNDRKRSIAKLNIMK